MKIDRLHLQMLQFGNIPDFEFCGGEHRDYEGTSGLLGVGLLSALEDELEMEKEHNSHKKLQYFFTPGPYDPNEDRRYVSLTEAPSEEFLEDHLVGDFGFTTGEHWESLTHFCHEVMCGTPVTDPCEDVIREFYLWDDAEEAWWYHWQGQDGHWFDNLETYTTKELR